MSCCWCWCREGDRLLWRSPAPGITFEDLEMVGRALVTGGVPIAEMNTVRRQLSSVKNGGIAKMAGERPVASLLISDVVDGPRRRHRFRAHPGRRHHPRRCPGGADRLPTDAQNPTFSGGVPRGLVIFYRKARQGTRSR